MRQSEYDPRLDEAEQKYADAVAQRGRARLRMVSAKRELELSEADFNSATNAERAALDAVVGMKAPRK